MQYRRRALQYAGGINMAISNYTVVVAEDEELLLENLIRKIENTGLGFKVTGKAQTGTQAYRRPWLR